LFISLSGGAYALTVTGKNIKDGTVTGKDVKKHTLTTKHFKGHLPRGRRGLQGLPGLPGAVGTGVLAEISGDVTLPAVQSPTILPISLTGNTFTTQSAAWVGGAASFPNGHPCAGAQSVGTVLLISVDGESKPFVESGVIPSEPSSGTFAFSVPPGAHTVTANGRASCSNAPLRMELRMTVFGR